MLSASRAKESSPCPFWTLRFPHGLRFGAWLRLLRRNRFKVRPSRLGLAATISLTSAGNSILGCIQEGLIGPKLDAVEVPANPVFIVGCWRSGTTLLHTLLSMDPLNSCPDSYACYNPSHFVFTRSWIAPLFRVLLPRRRPMDDVPVDWEWPQEDEFALLNLGFASPYEYLVFPQGKTAGYLAGRSLETTSSEDWGSALLWFLRRVLYERPGRLILKSPPHSFRVVHLSRLFPDACFVRLDRDPLQVYPSLVATLRAIISTNGLQSVSDDALREAALESLSRLTPALDEGLAQLPPGRHCRVRYEELVERPVEILERIYASLGWGSIEHFRPRLLGYVRSLGGHRPNRWDLSEEEKTRIEQRLTSAN